MPQIADAVPLITACGAIVAAFSQPPRLWRRQTRALKPGVHPDADRSLAGVHARTERKDMWGVVARYDELMESAHVVATVSMDV